ncbi:MAG TPA: EthD family reductase [Dehalococcoidia bacterium]|nr:EthD family reductase [Dehalococcoidia bacterium]
MIKGYSMLRRRPDQSREEFQRWWMEDLVPVTSKLPGLRGYKVCLTLGSTSHPDNPPFDGLAEIWFDDLDAFYAAFASAEGKATVDCAMSQAAERWTLIVEEHTIISLETASY